MFRSQIFVEQNSQKNVHVWMILRSE